MKLSEFFDRAGTRKIVINTDIDGFLSGMLLKEYYQCEIVGFSNSKESIWVTPEIESVRSPIYIDIFINSPEVYCIDQHIVAKDDEHYERLRSYNTKMNPNLDIEKRVFTPWGYFNKYPFGTVHYLIALMKEDGHEVVMNDLYQKFTVHGSDGQNYTVTPGQLLLRADDALHTTLSSDYEKNAHEWWTRLGNFRSNTISRLVDYIHSLDKSDNEEYKRNIGLLFRHGLNCDGIDGGFDRVTDRGSCSLQNRVLRYNEVISRIMGIDLDLPRVLNERIGEVRRGEFKEENYRNAFTYAVVWGPKNSQSLSYTIPIGNSFE